MDASLPVAEEGRIIARERLRLLEIGYYIRGGITFAFSGFFLLYVVILIGLSFVPDDAWASKPAPVSSPTPGSIGAPAHSPSPVAQAPPKALFRIMAGVLGLFMMLGWTFAALSAYAGWCIRKRQRKILVYVMAGLNCVFIPYGTLLGVMTFLAIGSPAGQLEFQSRGV